MKDSRWQKLFEFKALDDAALLKKKKKNVWVLSVASRALQFEKQSTKRGRCCTYEEKVNVQMADSFCFVRSSRQRIYLQMRKNLIFAFTFLPHLPPFSSFFDNNLYQNRFNDLHEERDRTRSQILLVYTQNSLHTILHFIIPSMGYWKLITISSVFPRLPNLSNISFMYITQRTRIELTFS